MTIKSYLADQNVPQILHQKWYPGNFFATWLMIPAHNGRWLIPTWLVNDSIPSQRNYEENHLQFSSSALVMRLITFKHISWTCDSKPWPWELCTCSRANRSSREWLTGIHQFLRGNAAWRIRRWWCWQCRRLGSSWSHWWAAGWGWWVSSVHPMSPANKRGELIHSGDKSQNTRLVDNRSFKLHLDFQLWVLLLL